jgi:hypothetical protein
MTSGPARVLSVLAAMGIVAKALLSEIDCIVSD